MMIEYDTTVTGWKPFFKRVIYYNKSALHFFAKWFTKTEQSSFLTWWIRNWFPQKTSEWRQHNSPLKPLQRVFTLHVALYVIKQVSIF